MIRRINFTNRKRIPRDRVRVELTAGQPRRLTATLELDGLSLSGSSAIYLEAMCAGSPAIERFACGDVAHPSPPRDQPLGEIEGENVFFTLKVVDRAEHLGRIEGIAENIRPERSGKEPAPRKSILPIEPRDLGEQLWELEFRQENVFLIVNSRVPGFIDRVHADPLVYSLMYPAIVREILSRAFREASPASEEDERWPSYWLRFGRSLHSENIDPATIEDEEEQQEWIAEVSGAFCKRHRLAESFAAAGYMGGDP